MSLTTHRTLNENELILFRTRICEKHKQGLCQDPDKCPNSHCHTWQRRNPVEFLYSAKLCSDIKFVKQKNKMNLLRRCSRGRGCCFAHSKEEELYHPSNYKTKLCSFDAQCTRYYCPFAHSEQELRNLALSYPFSTNNQIRPTEFIMREPFSLSEQKPSSAIQLLHHEADMIEHDPENHQIKSLTQIFYDNEMHTPRSTSNHYFTNELLAIAKLDGMRQTYGMRNRIAHCDNLGTAFEQSLTPTIQNSSNSYKKCDRSNTFDPMGESSPNYESRNDPVFYSDQIKGNIENFKDEHTAYSIGLLYEGNSENDESRSTDVLHNSNEIQNVCTAQGINRQKKEEEYDLDLLFLWNKSLMNMQNDYPELLSSDESKENYSTTYANDEYNLTPRSSLDNYCWHDFYKPFNLNSQVSSTTASSLTSPQIRSSSEKKKKKETVGYIETNYNENEFVRDKKYTSYDFTDKSMKSYTEDSYIMNQTIWLDGSMKSGQSEIEHLLLGKSNRLQSNNQLYDVSRLIYHIDEYSDRISDHSLGYQEFDTCSSNRQAKTWLDYF